jgi:hypothetical protein
MKKTLLFFILFYNVSLLIGQIINPFKIQTYHFKADTTIKSAVLWNDKFYCLESNGDFIVVDSLRNNIKLPIKNRNIKYLYSKNDTLFCLTNWDSLFYISNLNLYYLKNINWDKPIFEDSRYVVRATCSGEWGGSIYFIDKTNHKKYECAATCPVVVNKLNNSYFITAALDHLSGCAEILQIDDPTKLKKYKNRRVKKNKVYHTDSFESHSKKGAITMIDTCGTLILSSFILNNTLYHIVTEGFLKFDTTKSPKTFLCIIKNNSFVKIAELSDKQLYNTYDFFNYDINSLIIFKTYGFTRIISGFIYINNDKINIYEFEEK